jgi:hypothetical protein
MSCYSSRRVLVGSRLEVDAEVRIWQGVRARSPARGCRGGPRRLHVRGHGRDRTVVDDGKVYSDGDKMARPEMYVRILQCGWAWASKVKYW